MFAVEIKDAANKRVSYGHSTRGTLINIPLRSMLINAGRDTVKDSQQYRSGTSFKIAST